MVDPVGAFEGWLTRNAAIVIGLAIGTAAKYGMTLTEGRKLTWLGVFADLLLLGLLGSIAIEIADLGNLTGNARVLAGALSAVSSDRLIRLVRDRFLKRLEGDLDSTVAASSSTAVEVPAGIGQPASVTMQPGTADTASARAGTSLKKAFASPTRQRPPPDQIDALRRIDTTDL